MTFAVDAQAIAALAALVVMLPATLFGFAAAVRRWGMPAGYNVAFASYWLACGALAFAGGGARVAAMLVARTPSPLQIIVLATPVIGAIVFALVPQWRHASGPLKAWAAARALPNTVVEELFWRALPAALFPSTWWLGWILPALTFASWHVAPLRATGGVRRRHVAFLGGALLIGLGYGWVAWSTQSIVWTTAAHFLVDACGLDAARTSLAVPNVGRQAARA